MVRIVETRVLSAVVLAFATVVTAASASHAQSANVQKPFVVKVGALFPSDSDTKDATGKTHVSVGLSYDFSKSTGASPMTYGVYGDYFSETSKSATVTDGESTLSLSLKSSAWGVGVSGRSSFGVPGAGTMPYAGLGVGVYSAMAKGTIDSNGVAASASKTTTGIGGKVFAGIESTSGFLAEVEYDLIPKVKDAEIKLSGFGARIGYRF